MNRLIYALISCVLLTGCEQRVAEFAKKTNELLSGYQERIEAQIKLEAAFYQRHAALDDAHMKRLTTGEIDVERDERSWELAARYAADPNLADLYRSDLREYGNIYASKQREWLTADTEGATAIVQQLITLEADKASIEAYRKVLKNLEKPRGIKDELTDLNQFIVETKSEFDKLFCADLKKQLGALSTSPQNETAAAKKEREEAKKVIEDLQKQKKCS